MEYRFKKNLLNTAILLALTGTPAVHAAEGDAVGDVIQLNSSTQTAGNQTLIWTTGGVAMDADGDFVAVWTDYYGHDGDSEGVYVRRFDADGNALDASERLVNTQTTNWQNAAGLAAAPDGRFVVIYTDGNTTNKDIYARLYNSDGSEVDVPFQVNTVDARVYYSDVAMAADGSFVVAWATLSGVMARRYSADGTALDAQEVTVQTSEAITLLGIAVSMDPAGNYLVTWTERVDFDFNVKARRYNADGSAIDSAEFTVDTTYPNGQSFAEARLNSDGSFVIAWSEDASGGSGVYAKCFDSTATVVKDRFGVVVDADYTGSYIGIPYVAMDAEGDFAITAIDYGTSDGDGYATYMQRYDSSCNAQYAEPVNVGGPAGSDGAGSIAMDADGDIVVAFTNTGGDDGDGYGVFAQRYEGKSHGVDLSLVGRGDTNTLGGDLIYTFTVTNNGNGTAVGLKLEDALPTNVSYSGFSSMDDWSCSDSSGTVTCTLPNLAASAQSSVDITVDTSGVSSSSITSSAIVTNGVTDSDNTNNSDTVTTGNSAPTFDSTPTVSGTLLVGQILSVSASATDPEGGSVTLGYQWQADGVDIAGATGSSYTLTSAEAHTSISVVVTADDGSDSTTAISTSRAVLNSAPAFDTTPTLSGGTNVGDTLTLSGVSVTDSDSDTLSYSYLWYADGAVISGTTSDSYTVQDSDAGSDITATVTASDGYGGVTSATTAAVSILVASSSSGSGGGGAFGWFGLLLCLLGVSLRRK